MPGFFSIPGLGSAKPNETLPASNFAPEVLSSVPNSSRPASKDGESNAGPETQGESIPKITADKPTQREITGVDQASPATDRILGERVLNGEPHDAKLGAVQGEGPRAETREVNGTQVLPTTGYTPEASHITDALSAALGDVLEVGEGTTLHYSAPDGDDQKDAQPEWEADSSPYESSSSSDSSDDSSEDDESDTEMVSVQEAARLLLEAAEDGSDDEDDGKKSKGGGPGNQVRSKNEQSEDAPPKPNVIITDQDPITLLGTVLHVVEQSVVIKGDTVGEFRVLDATSVLCTENRTILGVVADVIGNVRHPIYLLRFSQDDEALMASLEPGTRIFYPANYATFVFTSALRNLKGSDASNFYDEEVGDEEMEFSDDEKESAYKRGLKDQRVKKRGGKGRDGAERNSHPLRNEVSAGEIPATLDYDDGDDDDGPYRPLARPAGFGRGTSGESQEPPPGVFHRRGRGDRGGQRGHRGRGGRGGRGDRGRGDRGRGRGGHSSGYSLPPQSSAPAPSAGPLAPNSIPPPSQWPFPFPPPPPQQLQPPTTTFNFPFQAWHQPMPQAAPAGTQGFAYPPPPPTYYGEQPQAAWQGQAAAHPSSSNSNHAYPPQGWAQGQGHPGWGGHGGQGR